MPQLIMALVACLATLLILIGGLTKSLLIVITVEHQSMAPALQHGDRILAIRRWPSRWESKGRVVIVTPFSRRGRTRQPSGMESVYIKRITGVAGETVTASLAELGLHYQENQRKFYDDKGERDWYIPRGYVFVQGDNRRASIDSVFWGPVSVQCIQGLAIIKLR